MMLIIVDSDTQNSVDWLVENTSKSFVFKQTLELAQLICSSGLSSVYKKLNQAKELREWVKNNSFWVQDYFYRLIKWCEGNVNLSEKTKKDWWQIRHDILSSIGEGLNKPIFPNTAIWRYSKDYESEYPTNSELEFNLVCNLYKTYLKDFKSKKKTNMSYKERYEQLKQEYSTVCYNLHLAEQGRDKLYNDLMEVVEPYLSDFTGYDEKEQAFNVVLAVKEILGQLEQENKELSKLIRSTKDYAEVCSECKDEVTVYPDISGRTDYTQNEIECRTLAQIITRKNNLEQKNEELKEQFEIETLKNNDTKECIYRSNLLNKYKNALEEINEIANRTIIDYTDIAKNNEKLKALDLRNRMSEIQTIITEAIGDELLEE